MAARFRHATTLVLLLVAVIAAPWVVPISSTAEALSLSEYTETSSISFSRGSSRHADRTPPSLSIVTPATGTLVEPRTEISGVAHDDATLDAVEVAVGNGPLRPVRGNQQRWSATLDLSAYRGRGVVLTARAVDAAGNDAAVSVRVVVADSGAHPAPEPEPDPAGPELDIPRPPNGPQRASSCAGGRVVQSSEDLHGIVEGSPPGARICLAAGIHRVSTGLEPTTGQEILGLNGAVLRGSKVLTGWNRDGNHWYVGGQTQRLHQRGRCSGNDTCHLAEDVFLDGAWLDQVTTRGQLSPGRFFFDYSADRIYLADDPTGRLVETTVARNAIVSRASDIVIRGLVIEQFGNPAQEGAIHIRGHRWLVEGNVVRHTHGVGIRTYGEHVEDVVIRSNVITRNGQLGIGGQGINLLVERNLISENNIAGFSASWEAGASKWVRTVGLVVRGNTAVDNLGHGLWTDIDNIHTLYEHNHSEGNDRSGIFHEISYDATIRGNLVRGNGFARVSWASGAGIRVANSTNVTVIGNVVDGNGLGITLSQQDRGTGRHGPWDLRNVTVSGNTILMPSGYSGLFQDVGDLSYFRSKGNRFTRNHYMLTQLSARQLSWENRMRNPSDWQAYGNDRDGSFDAYR